MVPAELVDHILGFLHSDKDYTTLETCSAIFPHRLVDRHLYSHITFTTNYEPTNPSKHGNYVVDPTKFSLTLIDRPHVANCVRSVCIFIQLALASEWPELQIISSNLPILSRLKSIALDSNRHLLWPLLDPGFRTALRNSIRLPSIKEVDITNIDLLPLDLFDDCKNLTSLLLFSQCTASGELVPMPYLRSFGIECRFSNLIMPGLVSWMKGNTLHSLSLRMNYHMDLPKFRTLIEACSATLVNLELDHRSHVGSEYSPQGPIFSGLQLPLLKRIIVQADVYTPYHKCHLSSLPLLVPFFSSIPSTRFIRLLFHLRLSYSPGSQPGLHWSAVADFLALPVFRHPQIELCIHKPSGSPPLAGVVSSFEQNLDLKRLVESGKLVIKYS